MKLKDMLGRVTVVLTPELRQLALDHIAATGYGDEEENLRFWFSASESPDGTVLDAAYSEAEAVMINVILQATLIKYTPAEPEPDPDEHIRLLTR